MYCLLLLYAAAVSIADIHNQLPFHYTIARMSTDSLTGKSLGSGISTYFLMGKCLGHSLHVLFAFTSHIPVQLC